MTWWKKTPIKIGIIFILPVLIFTVWNLFVYPLQPHCSLGNGLFGCIPNCEPVSYFNNGKPSDYKVIPCFHDSPSTYQQNIYKNMWVYYSLIGLITLFIAIKIGLKKFFVKILRIILAPFVLIFESKNKKFFPRILIIIASFFLIIEWSFVYLYIIQTLTGIKLINW